MAAAVLGLVAGSYEQIIVGYRVKTGEKVCSVDKYSFMKYIAIILM